MTTDNAADAGDNLRLIALVAVGGAICFITFGVRSAFGIFTEPLSAAHGWQREVFGLSIAVQNLAWGLVQPLAGGLVDRFGARRVTLAGGLLFAAGMALMPAADQPVWLHLSAGLLVGVGMGGASYVTVIGALGRSVPARSRSWALGVATAAGSLGQFLVVPMGQLFVGLYGWQSALLLLAALVGAVPVLALGLGGRAPRPAAASVADGGVRVAVSQAFAHPSYIMLLSGFFVCGFQLTFITIYLPPTLTSRGGDTGQAAWVLAVIGLANVLGAYAAGVLGGRFAKRKLLSLIYVGRAAAIALLVLLPPSLPAALSFAVVMGLLWLSTVPLTSGLVAVMFGTRHLGTLFGVVFLAHQVGSFLGAWLGGLLFDRTASYDAVWWISAALGVAAALVNLPIAERTAPRAHAAAE